MCSTFQAPFAPFIGGGAGSGICRTSDLGSFEQFRNTGNCPERFQGDAFPVHDSRDAVGGRLHEDAIMGMS
jgi:hypothetical protein